MLLYKTKPVRADFVSYVNSIFCFNTSARVQVTWVKTLYTTFLYVTNS